MAFNKRQVENFYNRTDFDLEKGRKTMDALRARSNKLKRMLEKTGEADYQPTDEIHLATIAMCEDIQLRAFADIAENGVMITVDKDQKVKQKNHSISTFYQMTKLINDTSKKLGLSALDRKELNIQPELEDDMPDD